MNKKMQRSEYASNGFAAHSVKCDRPLELGFIYFLSVIVAEEVYQKCAYTYVRHHIGLHGESISHAQSRKRILNVFVCLLVCMCMCVRA